MELIVNTNITKKSSEFTVEDCVVKNRILATQGTDTSFSVGSIIEKNITIKHAEAGAFNVNILQSLNIQPTTVTFIHIQCNNATVGPKEVNKPIAFNVIVRDSTSQISLGTLSQLQLTSIKDLPTTYDITISTPAVEVDRQALMTIVIGVK